MNYIGQHFIYISFEKIPSYRFLAPGFDFI